MKKEGSNLGIVYIFATVGLIILAIIVSAIINSVKSGATSADIRARAGVKGTLQFVGVVTTADAGVLTVSDLKFADSRNGKSLGTWQVTPGQGVDIYALPAGSKVLLAVDPKTFLAETFTLTAVQIKRTR